MSQQPLQNDSSKNKTNGVEIPSSHPYCEFKKKDNKTLMVTLKSADVVQKGTDGEKDQIPDILAGIKQMCESSLSAQKKGKTTIYYLTMEDLEGFLENIVDIEEGRDPELSDEESSSTDDEMLHKALARRYKYKTTQPRKTFDSHDVSDSEMEDPISISRRLRHLYNLIDTLTKRVDELESREK